MQWLAVFLGNPGPRYAGTRHNAGFLAADILAKDKNVSISHLRFRALTASCTLAGQQVLLMKPQTYMNESGQAADQAVRFYKIPPERVIVVSDDIHLPCGKLRVRSKGSSGGHNGLQNVIDHLGTDAFPRIRIGVGEPAGGGAEQIDWVLSVPKNADWEIFSSACSLAASAVEDYITLGAEKTMSKYN